MRGLILHGLGFLLTLRGEFADADATADLAEALALQTRDPFLPLAAGEAIVAGSRDSAIQTAGRASRRHAQLVISLLTRVVSDPALPGRGGCSGKLSI